MAFAYAHRMKQPSSKKKRTAEDKTKTKHPMTDQERLRAVAATARRYHQYLLATSKPTIADAGAPSTVCLTHPDPRGPPAGHALTMLGVKRESVQQWQVSLGLPTTRQIWQRLFPRRNLSHGDAAYTHRDIVVGLEYAPSFRCSYWGASCAIQNSETRGPCGGCKVLRVARESCIERRYGVWVVGCGHSDDGARRGGDRSEAEVGAGWQQR